MRTTITLEPDVAAAVERLRRSENIGMSAALNRLARAGLVERASRSGYVHRTHEMGQLIDVNNVGDVLTLLDETGQ